MVNHPNRGTGKLSMAAWADLGLEEEWDLPRVRFNAGDFVRIGAAEVAVYGDMMPRGYETAESLPWGVYGFTKADMASTERLSPSRLGLFLGREDAERAAEALRAMLAIRARSAS